jgi:hypothetical protein
MADVAQLGIKITTDGVMESANELDNLSNKAQNAENTTKGLSKSVRSNVSPMKNMRAQAQQVSYQLQDIAVQAQMGTSAFTILGQQGPQLASVFGPSGAVVGAVIAFAAILGGVLYESLGKASSEIDKMSKDANSLADTYHKLTEAQKAYLAISMYEEMAKNEKTIISTEKAIKKLNTTLAAQGAFLGTESTRRLNEELLGLAAVSDEAKISLKKYQDILNGVTPDTIKAAEAENDYIEKLSDEYIQLTLNGDALLTYQAIKNGVTESNLAGAIALQKEIDALKANAIAKKEAAKLDEQLSAFFDKETTKKTETAEKLESDLDAFFNKELERKAEKLRSDKEQAQSELLIIERSVMSQNQLIDSYEAEALARLQEQRGEGLISLQEYETAKTQIVLNAANERNELLMENEEGLTKFFDEQNNERLQKEKDLATAKNSLNQTILTQASSLSSNMAQMAADAYGKESAAYKAAFLVQQGVAIASAIMNTQVAAAAAIAPPPIGLGPIAGVPYAGMIQAMGAVNVGIIAGQTIAGMGRALGGQVRGGESYLVGERGPELLTMGTSGRIATNENLKKAVGSQGETVQQNVSVNFSIQANDTAGFDRLLNSRRGQIISMINQAVNDRGRASLA